MDPLGTVTVISLPIMRVSFGRRVRISTLPPFKKAAYIARMGAAQKI
jgi:hypothetical protein